MHNIGKGLVAGFVATLALSVIMVMKEAMGLMPELDVARMLGAMMGNGPSAGWVGHFVIGTVIWGATFAWLEPHLPSDRHWLRGVIFGLGAWLLMMLLGMPMAGAGLFGTRIGPMAPVMTLVLHVVYGAVLGGVYGLQRPTKSEKQKEMKVASDLPGRARAERDVEG